MKKYNFTSYGIYSPLGSGEYTMDEMETYNLRAVKGLPGGVGWEMAVSDYRPVVGLDPVILTAGIAIEIGRG